MFSAILLLFVVLIVGIIAERYKVVDTSSGQVRGLRKYTLLEHVPFYSFKGVPYAKPPLGELRFKVNLTDIERNIFEFFHKFIELQILKAPEPVDSWAPKVLNAFEHGPMCTQSGAFLPVPFTNSEDCLTLNIYVPGKRFQIHKRKHSLMILHEYIPQLI